MCGRTAKGTALLITAAGMSARFSESLKTPCLKCIYHERDTRNTLLYRLMDSGPAFEWYIIVGGYKSRELRNYIRAELAFWEDRIVFVENDKYYEYGSGYSLYLGLKAALDTGVREIVFAEGDLYVDRESFQKVCTEGNNVMTYNREPILADKSVVFYFNKEREVRYLYDTGHKMLKIEEPFYSIYHSGQIWKMNGNERIRKAAGLIAPEEWKGTNLVFIQRYFSSLPEAEISILPLKKWINCNTVYDYRLADFTGSGKDMEGEWE